MKFDGKPFTPPQPLESAARLASRYNIETWANRIDSCPRLTEAQYRVLALLYQHNHIEKGHRFRLTAKQVGYGWRAINCLTEAGLVRCKGEGLSFYPEGYRRYVLEYYYRLYQFQRWRLKRHNIPLDEDFKLRA